MVLEGYALGRELLDGLEARPEVEAFQRFWEASGP